MKSTNRKTYLDVLRIIANFLVVFNHTAGYTLYQYANSYPESIFYTTLSLLTKINIPTFLMITGVLLLGKEEEIGVVLRKRVLRFAILIFSANTLMYFVHTPFAEFDFMKWLNACLNCGAEGSYWYLYTQLGILIMLPYLRKIAAGFTKKDFKYFLIVHFVVATVIPFIDHFVFLSNGVHINVFPEVTAVVMVYHTFFYPLVGYYLDKNIDMSEMKFKKLLPLYGVCAVGIGIVTWLTRVQGLRIGFTEDYFKMFDYIFAITAFLTVKYLFVKREWLKNWPFVQKVIATVAPLTLGIYILDPALKVWLPNVETFLPTGTPILFVAIIWCVVSMILGGLITFVLKLIPGVKKVL